MRRREEWIYRNHNMTNFEIMVFTVFNISELYNYKLIGPCVSHRVRSFSITHSILKFSSCFIKNTLLLCYSNFSNSLSEMQHIIKTENFLVEFVRGFHCTSNFCIPAYTDFSYSNKSTSIFHHNLLHSEN